MTEPAETAAPATGPRQVVFPILNTLFLLAVLLSVVVQYNDPDGPLWMAVYGYAAIPAVLAYFRRYTILAPLGAVAYFAGALYLFPWDHAAELPQYVSEIHMSSQFSEWAREALGLAICGGWLVVLTACGRIRKPAANRT